MQSNVANKFNSINSDREKQNSKQIVVPEYQNFAEFTWRVAENFARLLKGTRGCKKNLIELHKKKLFPQGGNLLSHILNS